MDYFVDDFDDEIHSFESKWRVYKMADLINKSFYRYNWNRLFFLYEKNGQYEVSGENTCSLAMQSVADELKDLPGYKYEDGDLGLSTMNVYDFMKQKIGVNYASK